MRIGHQGVTFFSENSKHFTSGVLRSHLILKTWLFSYSCFTANSDAKNSRRVLLASHQLSCCHHASSHLIWARTNVTSAACRRSPSWGAGLSLGTDSLSVCPSPPRCAGRGAGGGAGAGPCGWQPAARPWCLVPHGYPGQPVSVRPRVGTHG